MFALGVKTLSDFTYLPFLRHLTVFTLHFRLTGLSSCSSFYFFSYCLRHGILCSCFHAMRGLSDSHSTMPANHDPSQLPPHPPSQLPPHPPSPSLSVAPQPWLCHRPHSLTSECLGLRLDISGHRVGGRGLGHLRKPKLRGMGHLEPQDAKRRTKRESCARDEGVVFCAEEGGLPAGIQRHSQATGRER